MRATITADLIRKLDEPCEVWDTKIPGLQLRVRASGRASYRLNYGRNKRITLGTADALTPAEARDVARQLLGDVARGLDPQAARRKRQAGSLRDFLKTHYRPWAAANRKTGDQTIARVRAAFPDGMLKRNIAELTSFQLEQWRSARRRAGIRDSTINRDLDALRAVLTKAVAWGVLSESPMGAVRRAKLDAIGRLRFLSPDEERRLREALTARDNERRAGRTRFNDWRRARGYKLLPEIVGPPDHLTTVTLLALNTGLRRGELLALTWGDLDLVGAMLTVRGSAAKSGVTRHVPLNGEAVRVLTEWRSAGAAAAALVFPGPDGGPMFSLKTSWQKVAKAAKLQSFTFHDLRHTFASKLVQAGVDLNTVRELLGHADIKMTLRYAHLAPAHKAAAVAKLVAGA
jgi:integrase